MNKSVNISSIAWKNLTSLQKYQRNLIFEVIRLIRKGHSLSSASEQVDLSKYLIKKFLGRYIFKKRGRFVVTKTDSIQRSMEFYDRKKGRIFVVVRNSKDASLIGEYFSAVRKAINGDQSNLKKFKNKIIIDADGIKHRFETRLEKIFDIEEEIEEPEFREIYGEIAT